MDDVSIVDLYWARSEQAIAESRKKYGAYCSRIARQILQNTQDTEECVSGTWWGAWNAMPPHRPARLDTFLGKITRRLALDLWRSQRRQKRGGGETALALEELEEVLGRGDVETELEGKELTAIFNDFLRALPADTRDVFLCRYWYMASVAEIAGRFGWSESKVKSLLYRTRQKLAQRLQEEGYQ